MENQKKLSNDVKDIFFAYEDGEIISELYDLFKGLDDAFLKSTLLSILDDTEGDEVIDYELLADMIQCELESVERMEIVLEGVRLCYE